MVGILGKLIQLDGSRLIKNSTEALAVLELCQKLIRYQDFEIFQPGIDIFLLKKFCGCEK